MKKRKRKEKNHHHRTVKIRKMLVTVSGGQIVADLCCVLELNSVGNTARTRLERKKWRAWLGVAEPTTANQYDTASSVETKAVLFGLTVVSVLSVRTHRTRDQTEEPEKHFVSDPNDGHSLPK